MHTPMGWKAKAAAGSNELGDKNWSNGARKVEKDKRMQQKLLRVVTEYYLKSDDFNGIQILNLLDDQNWLWTYRIAIEKNIIWWTDHEKTIIQRQIDSTDRRIDTLVYELYGLTEEEIKVVEGSIDGK